MEIALLVIIILMLIGGPATPIVLVGVIAAGCWMLLEKAWLGFCWALPWLLGAVLVWVIIIAPILGIK